MNPREQRNEAGASEESAAAVPASAPGDPPPLVVLGQIAGAHALRGEVRVRFEGDGPENLARAEEVWLADSPGDPAPERFEIKQWGTGRRGEVRLALRGVSDRGKAEALRGKWVLGDPAELLPLAEGEFYWHELVGCRVFDETGSFVGVVQELWQTAGHDLLVVEAEDGERHLLSTARELMPEVDVAAGRIVVVALSGMLDAPIGRQR